MQPRGADDDAYDSACSDSDSDEQLAPTPTRLMIQQAYGAYKATAFTAAEQAQNALIAAQSNVEAVNAIASIHQEARAIRPKNTQSQYNSKAREFEVFCQTKWPGDPYAMLVNEQKLALFLQSELKGRTARKGRGAGVKLVGVQTVKAYIAAIVDPYQLQKKAGGNTFPHPRGASIRDVVNNWQHTEFERQREAFEDPGAGTDLDGYQTVQDLQTITDSFLKRDTQEGLRDRTAFLLCHAGLLRGNNVRLLEFSALQCSILPNEGYSRCIAFKMVMRQSKTNQTNAKEYGAFIRSKEAAVCPAGSLAFYLFDRLQGGNEAFPPDGRKFPDLSAGSLWYQIKLLRAPKGDLTEPIPYSTQLRGLDQAYATCGMAYKAKTHVTRGAGARFALNGGASENSVERGGRWGKNKSSNVSYFHTYPFETMRALAGFRPEGGCFWLERAVLEPPQDLQSLVFPEVEDWEAYQAALPAKDRSLAASGFLKVLKELRIVLLQDAVIMRKEQPDWYMWTYPLFSDERFIAWEEALHAAISSIADPVERRLEESMPALTAHLQAAHTGIHERLKRLEDQQEKFQNSQQKTLESLQSSMNHSLTMISQLSTSMASQQPGWEVLMRPTNGSGMKTMEAVSTSSDMEINKVPYIPPSFILPPMPAPNALQPISSLQGQNDLFVSNPAPAICSTTSSVPLLPAPRLASFKMSRTIQTAAQAWQEYDVGHVGGRSIRAELQKGSQPGGKCWYTNDATESRFWCRRRNLISWIEKQAELRGLTCAAVADHLDVYRLRKENQQKGKTPLSLKGLAERAQHNQISWE